MMILAPLAGRVSVGGDADDAGPIQWTGGVTALSQPSSCEDSCDFEEEYHEPAWLARRTDMIIG